MSPESQEKLKYWAQQALDVQDACNLSGVVFAMARMMEDLCAIGREINQGTSWRNSHPITRLFVDKLNSLACTNVNTVCVQAYDNCEKLAKGGS